MTAVHVRLRVGAEDYAAPVEHVLEVARLGGLTTVPGGPPALLGVRNLRGHVLPVFDLATVLGLGRGGEPSFVLVAEQGGRRAGLAVDAVTDVGALPEAVEEAESEFLAGAALVEGELVGVLDLGRVLDVLERGT